jgi:SAM-dependent methyltransferase
VVAFGVIHHIPKWRDAMAEVKRVLKPGGRFWAEESFENFITHPVWKRLLHHPQEDRFGPKAFQQELDTLGYETIGSRVMAGETVGWYVAQKAQRG